MVEEKKRSQENNRRNKYGHDKEEVDVTADKRVDRANGGDQYRLCIAPRMKMGSRFET